MTKNKIKAIKIDVIWHRFDGHSLVSHWSVESGVRGLIGYFRLFFNQFSIDLNFHCLDT